MTPFTKKVIEIISNIPIGKVMTFGQVAACAGSPRGARQVVRILHSMSEKYALPWHRIINAKGQIGFQDEEAFHEQKQLLLDEGITFRNETQVDLKVYRFDTGD